ENELWRVRVLFHVGPACERAECCERPQANCLVFVCYQIEETCLAGLSVTGERNDWEPKFSPSVALEHLLLVDVVKLAFDSADSVPGRAVVFLVWVVPWPHPT